MDVRDLSYDDETFDLIIDKSTMDALLCGDQSFLNVAIMTKEVQRVLKTGGIYMIISYGQPENRIPHLEREHLSFDISIYTIKKDSGEEQDKEKV
jgi:ubiquinone/menaquinone biosynthesis C-methylase UbiE